MQEERSRQAVLTTTAEPDISLTLTVNGARHTLRLEPRVSLLDALRESLDITNPKKGCNQGCRSAHRFIFIFSEVISATLLCARDALVTSTTGAVRFQSRPVADIVQRGFDTRKNTRDRDFHSRGSICLLSL